MKKLERKTKRLVIRPLKNSDFKAWNLAIQNQLPSKNKWDTRRQLTTEASLKDYRKIISKQNKNIKDDYFYNFAVFLKSGELVGFVSLMDISRVLFQNAYLGYYMFNNHWGNGYGKEAVKAVIDIGFKDLNLHRIEAGIEPNNKRSIALAKSVGLRYEGLSKRRLYLGKKWIDLRLYAATSEDFGIKWKAKK